MKKLTLLLILVIGWSVSNCQFAPIQPYNESGYTQEQFIAFAQKQTTLSLSYKNQTINLVKSYLKSSGLSEPSNDGNPFTEQEWLFWIFDPSHTYPEQRQYPKGFWNTRIENGYVRWFKDNRGFTGTVMVLHYEGFEFDLGKTICTNLVNIAPTYKIFSRLPSLPASPVYQKKTEEPNFQFKSIPDENPIAPKPSPIPSAEEKNKVKGKASWPWIVGGIILGGVTTYLLTRKKSGGPGGAPITQVPTKPGGPGGAPITGGRAAYQQPTYHPPTYEPKELKLPGFKFGFRF